MAVARLAVLIVLLGYPSRAAFPQVTISPLVLVLTDARPVATYAVSNRSSIAQEVTVDFRFGYPRSDSLGHLSMQYNDSLAAARASVEPWLRAFPRRFLLEPGREQVVRLHVRPGAEVPAGGYWTRLVTASTPQSPLAGTAGEGIVTQINFRVEQVTTVLFRRGRASTGIEVGTAALHTDSAGAHLLIPLSRTGSAPFLGSVRVRVADQKGAVVEDLREPVAVYFDLVKRVSLPRRKLGAGTYSAEVSILAERSDIARQDLLPIAPAGTRATIVIP